MRFDTSMSVAVCVFAAGLGVAGCQPSNSSSSATGSATSSGSPAQATAAAASAQQPQAAGNVSRCQPKDLSFALGAEHQIADADGQWTQVVDMTNQGTSACTMYGFPGVDLIGDTKDQPSYDWSLVRMSAKGAQVTLQPGAVAHFDLTYLSGDLASGGADENVISVHKMVITPPDDTTQGSLAWAHDVVLQDTASSPGTYISPVKAGS